LTRRDILVVVVEGPVITVGFGGGLEGALRTKSNAATGTAVESFEVSPRGFVEMGRRNILGKNRSVTLFARAAIRSNDVVNADQRPEGVPPLDDEGAGFREYRVLGTYREPRFLGTGIDLLVSADAEQAIRSSFDFNRQVRRGKSPVRRRLHRRRPLRHRPHPAFNERIAKRTRSTSTASSTRACDLGLSRSRCRGIPGTTRSSRRGENCCWDTVHSRPTPSVRRPDS
jgi:hypothetical protein